MVVAEALIAAVTVRSRPSVKTRIGALEVMSQPKRTEREAGKLPFGANVGLVAQSVIRIVGTSLKPCD